MKTSICFERSSVIHFWVIFLNLFCHPIFTLCLFFYLKNWNNKFRKSFFSQTKGHANINLNDTFNNNLHWNSLFCIKSSIPYWNTANFFFHVVLYFLPRWLLIQFSDDKQYLQAERIIIYYLYPCWEQYSASRINWSNQTFTVVFPFERFSNLIVITSVFKIYMVVF